MNRIYAYIRLSREELDRPGEFQEKIERHRQIARDIAKRNDLPLPEENIVVELESGGTLRNRPELRRLLDLAHAGLMTHLIATAHDRIDRILDKREQADLEDALYAGEVTVVTLDGANTYNDDLDEFPVEIRALLARAERRNYSKRIKNHNRQRLAKNQRVAGFAPWGYRRNKESESGYDIIPSEYEEVKLVFQRMIAGWSLRSILADLNDRQVPPGSVGRFKNHGSRWGLSALLRVVTNPFYAGYHARQTRTRRDGSVVILRPAEYQLGGGEPGGWPCPITLAQWHEIVAGYKARAHSSHLLTGILRCPDGIRMTASGQRQYRCREPRAPDRTKHNVLRAPWDAFAKSLAMEFITRIPPHLLEPQSPPPDRTNLLRQLSRATSHHKKLLDELQQFAREAASPESPLRHFDAEMLQSMVMDMEQREAQARRDMERLQVMAAAPELSQVSAMLKAIKERGADWTWGMMTMDERRMLLRSIVERIQLQPTAGPKCRFRRAEVVWQQWVVDHGLSFEVPEELWAAIIARKSPESI